ncbi:MAG: ferredoxin [archaeon]|nr:ferredoxin [archaeon]
MTKYKIKINEEECIGCGTCAALCAENYEMTDNGKAKVKNAEVDEPGCNEEAKESCPVSCIKIEEA